MKLNELKPPIGANKRKRIVGRGVGSGCGKTAGRGTKGQKSRTGSKTWVGFEGGQMPLIRRIPKRGFRPRFKKEYSIINLYTLAKLKNFNEVTPDLLRKAGLIKSNALLKVLGDGKLERPVTIRAHAFSRSAKAKIESVGGKTELLKSIVL